MVNSTFERIKIIQDYGIDLGSASIFISGELSSELSMALHCKIAMFMEYYNNYLHQQLKEVNIFINSRGGDASVINAMKDFYDFYKKKGILINVKVEGECYSTAVLFAALASGKRIASKNSRFMVHELGLNIAKINEFAANKSEKEKSKLANVCVLYDQILSYYANLSIKKKEIVLHSLHESEKLFNDEKQVWEERCQTETYFSSEEALAWGLIDEID